MAYVINKSICIDCQACHFACPFDVPVENFPAGCYDIPRDKCRDCGECVDICPVGAISPAPGMKMRAKVEIITDNCIGCTACARACPTGAITGTVKNPHVIDQNKCIKCGECATKCKKSAVKITYVD